jgi:hypothetical protein
VVGLLLASLSQLLLPLLLLPSLLVKVLQRWELHSPRCHLACAPP